MGAVEAVNRRLPRIEGRTQPLPFGWAAAAIQLFSGTAFSALSSVVPAGFDEHRVVGRSLSLERAADLALRVLDEELVAASAAAVPAGDGAAGIANTPRRQGR